MRINGLVGVRVTSGFESGVRGSVQSKVDSEYPGVSITASLLFVGSALTQLNLEECFHFVSVQAWSGACNYLGDDIGEPRTQERLWVSTALFSSSA